MREQHVQFQIGEKVVYPNLGVGVIENISTRLVGGQCERFYLLRLLCTRTTVMIPVSHAAGLRLRRVTCNGEITKVLAFLANGSCPTKGDWKDRFKLNCEKMQSGTLMETAEVLKSLLILRQSKPLSFREKKMLDRARQLLVTEIAVSRSIPEQAAAEMLDRALRKASLRLPVSL